MSKNNNNSNKFASFAGYVSGVIYNVDILVLIFLITKIFVSLKIIKNRNGEPSSARHLDIEFVS